MDLRLHDRCVTVHRSMATTNMNELNTLYSPWARGTALPSEDLAALGISADLAMHCMRAGGLGYFALVNSIPRH
jgi:hypothetical protein